jgi:hypothetical protein
MKKISLEDLSEEKIPSLDSEASNFIQNEHICYLANQALDSYRYGEFQNLRLSERDKEIGRKLYGIGVEQKTISELEKEYNRPNQRWNRVYIRDIKKRVDRALINNIDKFLK